MDLSKLLELFEEFKDFQENAGFPCGHSPGKLKYNFWILLGRVAMQEKAATIARFVAFILAVRHSRAG